MPKVGAEKSKRVESYMQIARLEDWPKDNVKVLKNTDLKSHQFCIDKSSIKSRV